MHNNVIASALTDPTQLLALPIVIFRAAAGFALAMLNQATTLVTDMFNAFL